MMLCCVCVVVSVFLYESRESEERRDHDDETETIQKGGKPKNWKTVSEVQCRGEAARI